MHRKTQNEVNFLQEVQIGTTTFTILREKRTSTNYKVTYIYGE